MRAEGERSSLRNSSYRSRLQRGFRDPKRKRLPRRACFVALMLAKGVAAVLGTIGYRAVAAARRADGRRPAINDARPLNQLRPCVSIYSAKSFLSGAASARPRASRSHQFSGDRRRNKLFPDDGKCCIQRYVLQSLACPAKSGQAPSCVYRSDTSAETVQANCLGWPSTQIQVTSRGSWKPQSDKPKFAHESCTGQTAR